MKSITEGWVEIKDCSKPRSDNLSSVNTDWKYCSGLCSMIHNQVFSSWRGGKGSRYPLTELMHLQSCLWLDEWEFEKDATNCRISDLVLKQTRLLRCLYLAITEAVLQHFINDRLFTFGNKGYSIRGNPMLNFSLLPLGLGNCKIDDREKQILPHCPVSMSSLSKSTAFQGTWSRTGS